MQEQSLATFRLAILPSHVIQSVALVLHYSQG